MGKVRFIVEADGTDVSLTSKLLKEIVDHLIVSVPQLVKVKSLSVMGEDGLNHISCGYVTAEKTFTTLPINSGLFCQNQNENKSFEQLTLPGMGGRVESKWGSDWVDDGV